MVCLIPTHAICTSTNKHAEHDLAHEPGSHFVRLDGAIPILGLCMGA